jgi:putative colanic acid biosysnthesis UDP-glucose lipid carrier transferase
LSAVHELDSGLARRPERERAAPPVGAAPQGVLLPHVLGRRFHSAPPSVSGFVAAVVEPMVYAASLMAAYALNGQTPAGPAIALSLLVMVLTIPAPNRFRDPPLRSAVGVAQSWLYVAGLLLACGLVTDTLGLYPREVLLSWAVAAPLGLWASALAGHAVLRWWAARPTALRRAVIVGAGLPAVKAAQALRQRGESHLRIEGYFDDRVGERCDAAALQQHLGGLADVAEHVKRHAIDAVYITLPLGSQPRIVALLESLQSTTASLYLVPDLFGISVIQGRLQDVNGVAVVGICETPFTGLDDAVKRASDLVLASLILLLTAPLMLALAVGVKLSSPGPVIFRQRRNGLGGEEIVVYKFRSMHSSDDGAVVPQARRDDPRVTRFGAFLRRSSLDELPQFFNVLLGQMSVVGPRPHAVAHNQQYAQIIQAYMVRHKVRPGITGWAQVNGHRGETDTVDKMRARVECDLDYLRHWSLWLDLHIIVRTLLMMLWDRKAY